MSSEGEFVIDRRTDPEPPMMPIIFPPNSKCGSTGPSAKDARLLARLCSEAEKLSMKLARFDTETI